MNEDRTIKTLAWLAFIACVIAVILGIYKTSAQTTTQQQSTLVRCPSGTKPQSTISTSTNTATVVCVATIATPTPTPSPTPQPTPTPIPSPSPVGVELPRVLIDSRMPTQTGSLRIASDSATFAQALKDAMPGDTIQLTAGVTYNAPSGGFILPAKSNPNNLWIVIRSSSLARLPEGARVTPANAVDMAKIVSNDASSPAISTAAGASFWRLAGLEITQGTSTINTLVRIGDYAATNTDRTAKAIGIDRCFIHGTANGTTRRGVELNGQSATITDSYISDIHESGADSQAICGWNGAGPFKIVNNYLEAAGENVMFGGSDPKISGLIPSDIEIRRNTFYKPTAWRSASWLVKNLFEIKSGQRIWVDGNTFENNWLNGQDGFAIVLKVANQDGGAPWTITSDITFTNNIIRHSGAGINLLGIDPLQSSQQMRRILIRNNLWEDINGATWGGTHGRWLQITGTPDVTIDRNTAQQSGNAIQTYGEKSLRFVFTNNVVNHNLYGVIGDAFGVGNSTINQYFPSCIFTNNVIFGANLSQYPAGNFTVATAGTGADLQAIQAAQGRP